MSSEISLDERVKPSFLRRVSSACIRGACSQLGLVILVIVYVILGAVLFEYLESAPEVQKRTAIQRSREECLKELWAITGKVRGGNVGKDRTRKAYTDLIGGILKKGEIISTRHR
ncbi:hypothetical protein EVAR_13399_1 [Eumeta japonica]|uniref:Uncharacterized protein n=1 Tax=Eumeta variegata TaxID=151549 RepID=A0A4C1V632_EUMVA|nr:hypothetical protein EVAR_13399_1 [Eumeta japonica]